MNIKGESLTDDWGQCALSRPGLYSYYPGDLLIWRWSDNQISKMLSGYT